MPRLLFSLYIVPLLFAACSTNNVTIDDSIGKDFNAAGVTGSCGLYDNGQGHFTIYNLNRFRDSGYSPGPTFDILQSLIAIQTGVVKDDKTMMPDSVTLAQAFAAENSTNDSVFSQLARRIGKDSLKRWIDSLRYGNADMGAFPRDDFWKDGHLTIPADEQLGLTKKLYFDQLPFFQRTQQQVREMFRKEENANYRLVYKTGRVQGPNGHVLGWIMGWEEENKHPYFFVLNVESPNAQLDVPSVGLQLVKNILRPMGFFAGTK
jgi:beta-lactamase class D